MKKMILTAALAVAAFGAHASEIEGKWRTVDDETKKPKAIVHITQNGGVFSGKIVAVADGVDNNCTECKQPGALIGRTVLTGLKEVNGKYEGGKITDPKSGKTYSAKAELGSDGKSLKVRGYLGVSALGRTQTWQRAD
ncbi:DUF2147 domain-containing protein [Neisseria leonii]|uniref:DUF2147 domain-containing protein n=1 Tax=Neisseria leonii TaxID=2995413 RepID=A0A9X4E569_9NEIS|nr:DUF2147 domain-containing protein [Neisseria sp. 51.81]MDD9327617.1 DUF2147 domain-containing protein [Neisseria sp. 51.81]